MRIVAIGLFAALALAGCGEPCGAECSSSDDCESDLICYAGVCAPSECASCSRGCNFADGSDGSCRFLGCSAGVAEPEDPSEHACEAAQ